MATVSLLFQYTIEDADGNTLSFPVYGTADDAAALSDLATSATAIGTDLNAIIEGAIRKVSFDVLVPLDGGWRTTPVAGSNVQETGLITFPLTSVPGKHYSQDIPCFYQAGFVGKTINLAATAVAAWLAFIAAGAGFVWTNDQWTSTLEAPTKGKKTFRKHR
jgi:hypothetical protein